MKAWRAEHRPQVFSSWDSPGDTASSASLHANNVAALRQLYDKMAASVLASESISELLDRLVGELEAVITLSTFGFYIVEASDSTDSLQLVHSQMTSETREAAAHADRALKQLEATCKSALRIGRLEFRRQLSPARTLVAVPIDRMGHPSCIGFGFCR